MSIKDTSEMYKVIANKSDEIAYSARHSQLNLNGLLEDVNDLRKIIESFILLLED
jgi:hypothetical protein